MEASYHCRTDQWCGTMVGLHNVYFKAVFFF